MASWIRNLTTCLLKIKGVSLVFRYNIYGYMKRLDQGRLRQTRGPETDMSRPGIEPGVHGGRRALLKRAMGTAC
jgi:hypothetical protein